MPFGGELVLLEGLHLQLEDLASLAAGIQVSASCALRHTSLRLGHGALAAV